MIVRLLTCVIAICLVAGAVQVADLATDNAVELAPDDAVAPEATAIVVVALRTATACVLPATAVPVSRLHVTDAFRPPQA